MFVSNMASKRNVKYVEQDEPSFLKKFKERVGYKEAANINDKFSEEADSSESKTKDDDGKIEDEEPVVVVLKPGDLSAEEVAKHREEHGDTECWDTKNDKPIFKKPEKRASSEKDPKKDGKRKKTNMKAVKNSKLLSFDEEEDE